MNKIFDCHAHINPRSFGEDLPYVIERAKLAGVKGIISVGETYQDCLDVLKLSKEYSDFIVPGIGLHPVQPQINNNEVKERTSYWEEVLPVLDLIRKEKDNIACIGEVGLDFSQHIINNESEKDLQFKILDAQIDLSNELDIPLNLHSRSAGHYVIERLISKGSKHVLLHAFDGKVGYALKGLEAGFYFSIPPSIQRSPQKQKLVKRLPLDRIILETDSPALSPIKDTINEPKNIIMACNEISRIKGISVEEVIKVTTENAIKLFPKLKTLI